MTFSYAIFYNGPTPKMPFSSAFLKINQFRRSTKSHSTFNVRQQISAFFLPRYDKHTDCGDTFDDSLLRLSERSFFYGSMSFEFFHIIIIVIDCFLLLFFGFLSTAYLMTVIAITSALITIYVHPILSSGAFLLSKRVFIES